MHGRDRELDDVVTLVRRRACKCVTITGMRGIGKSRVLEEAERRLALERIEARFVDLDGDGGEGASDDLVVDVGRPHGPVHVVAGPAALGARREREVALGALRTPSAEMGGRFDPAVLRRSPAVLLLCDAARIDLDELTVDELCDVGHVADASDGHPAVLEQLAGWLTLLCARDLAAAIDDGAVSLLPRALRRSWNVERRALGAADREVLAAVAAARSSFDARTARAAVRPQRRAQVAASLARLVSGGWLLREGRPTAPRLRVIRPLRELLVDERAGRGARRRLTKHFAERVRPIFEGTLADRSNVAELLDARDEIVTAWEDAHARGDALELPLAAALSVITASGAPDAAQHAERIFASIAAHPQAPRRARLELAYADALWFAGDAARADAFFDVARRGARRASDASLEALAWIRRATLGPELGDLDVADAQLRRAHRLLARIDEPRLRVLATGIHGFLLRARGDLEGALAAFGAHADLARAVGDTFQAALADASAADCHLARGRLALGLARYERAHRAMTRVDAGWARTIEGYMGLAAWESGALSEALARLGHALAGALTPRFCVVFSAARAGVFAELDEPPRAKAALARAEDAASGSTLAPHALAEASLLVDHALATDRASRRAARARIAQHLRTHPTPMAEDGRSFFRALERVRDRDGDASAPRAALPASALDGRPRLARVFTVLAERDDGAVTSAAELFRAAWPDERHVDRATADARVRKAVSLLRALGLRGSLITVDGGYTLRRVPEPVVPSLGKPGRSGRTARCG